MEVLNWMVKESYSTSILMPYECENGLFLVNSYVSYGEEFFPKALFFNTYLDLYQMKIGFNKWLYCSFPFENPNIGNTKEKMYKRIDENEKN